MAAGQQRKRLVSSNLHELKEKKKKRLDSSDYILNMRSHVHLQWDDDQKRVVAKREQIGITWKYMSPYVDSVPKFHSCLADVFSFPKEVFDLDNLMEVLSHEVWLTCLSASERKLLMQFLPSAFAEQAVQSLLTGENLHFGNPFLKWSTLLCSSDLHPDALLQKERQDRVRKKQYNLEINKYHTDMVAVLRVLKEKSEACEDPEKLWRKLSNPSDSSEGLAAQKSNDYSIQKYLPLKMCNRYMDVAKYMSYIKVNKRQLKMLKELKHSGDHIQSKSISRVLGDIRNFHVYPYDTYENDEINKLREHWMQVTKDTLAAFEKYNKMKFLKMQQMDCLEKELVESINAIHDKAKESVLGNSPEDHIEVDREAKHQSVVMSGEDDSRSHSISAHDHTLERIPSLNSLEELNSSISDQETRNGHTLNFTKDAPAPTESFDKMDSCQMVKEPKGLISPSKSNWISVNCKDFNYQKPSETHSFASSDVPLNQCQHFKVIDLGKKIIEQDAGQHLSSAFDVETDSQLYDSYSHSHDEVIPTFPMATGMLSSNMNGLSQPGLQFLMNDGNLPEADRFCLLDYNPQLFKEIHSCEKELYMQNGIDMNFSNKIRYDNQLGFYTSRCTLQSSATDGFGRQNWFPSDHQSHNVWPGIESSGSGVKSNNVDGSLFNASPEFRDLPCRSSFDNSGSDQLLRSRNYIDMTLSDPYIPSQANSSRGLTSAPIASLDTMWMNFSLQNPRLQESVTKPFMRHWHQ